MRSRVGRATAMHAEHQGQAPTARRDPVPNWGTPARQLPVSRLRLPIGSKSTLSQHICRTGYTPVEHLHSTRSPASCRDGPRYHAPRTHPSPRRAVLCYRRNRRDRSISGRTTDDGKTIRSGRQRGSPHGVSILVAHSFGYTQHSSCYRGNLPRLPRAMESQESPEDRTTRNHSRRRCHLSYPHGHPGRDSCSTLD